MRRRARPPGAALIARAGGGGRALRCSGLGARRPRPGEGSVPVRPGRSPPRPLSRRPGLEGWGPRAGTRRTGVNPLALLGYEVDTFSAHQVRNVLRAPRPLRRRQLSANTEDRGSPKATRDRVPTAAVAVLSPRAQDGASV